MSETRCDSSCACVAGRHVGHKGRASGPVLRALAARYTGRGGDVGAGAAAALIGLLWCLLYGRLPITQASGFIPDASGLACAEGYVSRRCTGGMRELRG